MTKVIPVVLVALIAVFFLGCNKDKFATKPKIEVKDYSSKDIPKNGGITIRLTYFDKEGDLGKGNFFAVRYRTNLFPPSQDKADTLNYALPEFPNKDKGEISMQLDYSFLSESLVENDSMYFRIAVTDIKGNASDTIKTAPIVVHFQ